MGEDIFSGSNSGSIGSTATRSQSINGFLLREPGGVNGRKDPKDKKRDTTLKSNSINLGKNKTPPVAAPTESQPQTQEDRAELLKAKRAERNEKQLLTKGPPAANGVGEYM